MASPVSWASSPVAWGDQAHPRGQFPAVDVDGGLDEAREGVHGGAGTGTGHRRAAHGDQGGRPPPADGS
ncbi:hypothetical protein [Streptomyces sp. NPDC006527]|uniref:hypothetical protein n=1 Tax=Streptomyces sp. NPDC006527 TaxID=3364749 RepID=UPI00368D97FF